MARVLIADDQADLLAILAARFRALGYEVLEASDGAQAVELAQSARPDIAILDVMMPELNGFQVCETIKEDEKLAQMPVILLTAKSTDADKFWGSEVGADLYLTKPVDPPDVVKAVKDLLQL